MVRRRVAVCLLAVCLALLAVSVAPRPARADCGLADVCATSTPTPAPGGGGGSSYDPPIELLCPFGVLGLFGVGVPVMCFGYGDSPRGLNCVTDPFGLLLFVCVGDTSALTPTPVPTSAPPNSGSSACDLVADNLWDDCDLVHWNDSGYGTYESGSEPVYHDGDYTGGLGEYRVVFNGSGSSTWTKQFITSYERTYIQPGASITLTVGYYDDNGEGHLSLAWYDPSTASWNGFAPASGDPSYSPSTTLPYAAHTLAFVIPSDANPAGWLRIQWISNGNTYGLTGPVMERTNMAVASTAVAAATATAWAPTAVAMATQVAPTVIPACGALMDVCIPLGADGSPAPTPSAVPTVTGTPPATSTPGPSSTAVASATPAPTPTFVSGCQALDLVCDGTALIDPHDPGGDVAPLQTSIAAKLSCCVAVGVFSSTFAAGPTSACGTAPGGGDLGVTFPQAWAATALNHEHAQSFTWSLCEADQTGPLGAVDDWIPRLRGITLLAAALWVLVWMVRYVRSWFLRLRGAGGVE